MNEWWSMGRAVDRRWWRVTIVVVYVIVLIENVQDVLLFSRQQVAHFMNNIFSGCHVEVDEWFHDLIAVLILRDLEGKQRINVDQPKIKTISTDGTKVGIPGGIRPVRVQRVRRIR